MRMGSCGLTPENTFLRIKFKHGYRIIPVSANNHMSFIIMNHPLHIIQGIIAAPNTVIVAHLTGWNPVGILQIHGPKDIPVIIPIPIR